MVRLTNGELFTQNSVYEVLDFSWPDWLKKVSFGRENASHLNQAQINSLLFSISAASLMTYILIVFSYKRLKKLELRGRERLKTASPGRTWKQLKSSLIWYFLEALTSSSIDYKCISWECPIFLFLDFLRFDSLLFVSSYFSCCRDSLRLSLKVSRILSFNTIYCEERNQKAAASF